jgi:hypothetical protein
LHAVNRFSPNWFPEPDAELFDVKPAPSRGQKMPQLVHDDEEIEKQEDLEHDEGNARDVD